ncbi:MAG: two-component regulator propeller domain-containing protein, partial [Bacteroidota bacterium]
MDSPIAQIGLPVNRTIFTKAHLLLFLLCCIVYSAQAQFEHLHEPWRWTSFTTKTGLPSDIIENITESDDGTPWVVTPKGIAWYDGFRWHAIDSAHGLPEIQANKIFKGRNGEIFVLTNRTLYSGGKEGFDHVFAPVDTLEGKITTAALFDSTTLIIATSNGVFYLLKGKELTPYSMNVSPTIYNIWRLRSGALWSLGNAGIARYKNNQWDIIFKNQSARSIVDNQSGDGLLSLESPRTLMGIWEWSANGEPHYSKTERGLPIRSLDISPSGVAIAVYQSGEIRIRRNGIWRFLKYTPPQISNAQVVKFRDNEDLWIGTDNGLFLYRNTFPQWTHWRYPFTDKRNIVMEVFKTSSEEVWIGTMDGLVIHQQNGNERRITHIDGKPLGLITGINEDNEGAIWIGSGATFSGAYRWDGVSWKHFGAREGLTAPKVHKIRKDRQGNLWFLGLGKHFESPETDPGAFQLKNGQFRSVTTKDGLSSNRVYSFVESKSGALWFGTKNGLCRFRDGEWKRWQFPYHLSNFIYSIAVDDDEQLWFSNFSSQLGMIDTNDSIRWILKNNLFGSRRIWDLQVDGDNRIWVAGERGLFSYKDGEWSTYNVETGTELRELRVVLPLKDKVYVAGHGVGVGILNRKAINYPIKIQIVQPVVESPSVLLRWTADARWGVISSDQIEVRHRIDGGAWSGWIKQSEIRIAELSDGEHLVELQPRDIYGNLRDDIFRTAVTI